MPIYLPNVYRLAFGCDSVVDVAVAKKKAQAYADRTGKEFYVPGLGTIEPGQIGPPAPDTSIGNLTVTGDDLTGNNVALTAGAETTLTAAFDGDDKNVRFKWSIRTGTSAVVKSGSEEATVTLEGVEAGDSALLCTLSSDSASDSPQDKAFVVGVTV
jgi:hypothetical protein